MPRVDKLPDTGRVVIAHPSARLIAGVWAEREGIDFMLSDRAPKGQVYVMEVDAFGFTYLPASE